MNITDFDDIRPYNPDEFLEAMQRIAHSSSFPILSAYVYPEESVKEIRQRIANYQTVREFQQDTMSKVNQQVIENSITEFSCSGLDKLSPEGHYLYVSNHRDIMLDSSLLQTPVRLHPLRDSGERTVHLDCPAQRQDQGWKRHDRPGHHQDVLHVLPG